jgi:hypothetical protein
LAIDEFRKRFNIKTIFYEIDKNFPIFFRNWGIVFSFNSTADITPFDLHDNIIANVKIINKDAPTGWGMGRVYDTNIFKSPIFRPTRYGLQLSEWNLNWGNMIINDFEQLMLNKNGERLLIAK